MTEKISLLKIKEEGEKISRKEQIKTADREQEKVKFFENRLNEIQRSILDHYKEIEKLRINNPQREVGGKIFDGEILLHNESTWKESSVELDESYEELREWGEKGAVYFHTHPKNGETWESLGDIKCALYNLGEVIFTREDVLIIMPKEKFDHAKIQKVFQDAKNIANELSNNGWSDNDAYCGYLEEIGKNLPYEIIALEGLNLEQGRKKYETEYKNKAAFLNKQRSLLAKIFNKGKITYRDVAHEEAIEKNKKIIK